MRKNAIAQEASRRYLSKTTDEPPRVESDDYVAEVAALKEALWLKHKARANGVIRNRRGRHFTLPSGNVA